MHNILKISTSLNGDDGQSTKLADQLIAGLLERHPGSRVVTRDIGRTPVPHLTAERFAAFLAPEASRTPEQRAIVAESDALISELKAAAIVVLGLPLYNFGIPSALKSYFDHIARAGVTFRYTASGPEGLLGDRKLYVAAARGGKYLGTPLDTQSAYVRNFLGFLGILDVEFVYAEGLAYGEEARDQSLQAANQQIRDLVA